MMIIMANESDISGIASMRVDMQIEDWEDEVVSVEAKHDFYYATTEYLLSHLNRDLWFALAYEDCKLVAMCGIERLRALPQIIDYNERAGSLVSVYTAPEFRRQGIQRKLIDHVMNYVKDNKGITTVYCTTDSDIAVQLYKSLGFSKLSEEYYKRFDV